MEKEERKKYRFDLTFYGTYTEEDFAVEIDLTDEEVEEIKSVIANHERAEEETDVPRDEEDEAYCPPTENLLDMLEEDAPELFEKVWDEIYPIVYVKAFQDGVENEGEDSFPFRPDDNNFEDLYDYYGDGINIEDCRPCICKIPDGWSQS